MHERHVVFTLQCRVLIGLALFCGLQAQDLCQPVGWATQQGGVTGGGTATPVVAVTYNDLKSMLTSSSAGVVHVGGTIDVPAKGMITMQDMNRKTIFGLPGSKIVSTDKTKGGSGILFIKGCRNIVLRNLVFEGPGAHDVDGNDNLCIDNCQNVWVDHCEFHDGVDGNFDIKNKSDFISVTWCTFSYEKEPQSGGSGGSDDHRYSNLIGSSDNATGDDGHLNVTFQYCWWGEGCRERMPRMRFGKLHMVNNLFSSSVANNCIRAGYKADILAEGNYFDGQSLPIDEFNGDFTAIRAYDNYGADPLTKNTAFTPPYSLEVLPATVIADPIRLCAGATLTDPQECSACTVFVPVLVPRRTPQYHAGTSFFVRGTTVQGYSEGGPVVFSGRQVTMFTITGSAITAPSYGSVVDIGHLPRGCYFLRIDGRYRKFFRK